MCRGSELLADHRLARQPKRRRMLWTQRVGANAGAVGRVVVHGGDVAVLAVARADLIGGRDEPHRRRRALRDRLPGEGGRGRELASISLRVVSVSTALGWTAIARTARAQWRRSNSTALDRR